MRKYEELAQELTDAIKELCNNPGALENFQSYLSYHFPAWLGKYANTPETLTSEIKHFAKIGF